MASYQIIAWKDLPAMVEARDGSGTVTRPLSDRFQQLNDSVAMRLGLQGQDAYLDLWARGEIQERSGSAVEVADAVVTELEARFAEFIDRARDGAVDVS
ncbi:MAG: virulence factor [Candidatus Rokuibacteriota bacterium]